MVPRRRLISLMTCLLLCDFIDAQAAPPEPILLWPDGAPGALGTDDVDQPTIRIYRPEQPNGAAVVICPGGGYGALATDHEGHQVARWFQTIGVTSAVLKYRLGPRYHHPAPLQDVQRALRYLRQHAAELGIQPDRIGVMGFSAGGHLASTASTHFDAGDASAADEIDRISCRPDFSILGYPVISFIEDFGHKGSSRNLLGDNPDPNLLQFLSNELQVTDQTPPSFLFHTTEDTAVPPQNSLAYYKALIEHGIPAELHIYQNGPHGAGLGVGDPVLSTWKERLADWLKTNGLFTHVERAGVKGSVSLNGEPLSWGAITLISTTDENAPVTCARIRHGKYSLPAASGAVVGENRVVIHTQGTVAPDPTIDDVIALTGSQTLNGDVVVMIQADSDNEIDFDLQHSAE